MTEADVAPETSDLCNIVAFSDLHAGCRLGSCPPHAIKLDDGGQYLPSEFQRKLYSHWQCFWNEWVPEATRGEDYGIVCVGDVIDGVHHDSVSQVSHNLVDQARIAYELLAPLVDLAKGRFWLIRGTEAHVGKSAAEEERLGERLGTRPNAEGQFARWDLWKLMAGGAALVHFLHHIGVSGSAAYESTLIHAELVAMLADAARWRLRPPDAVVRAHRHRHVETIVPASDDAGNTACALGTVLPGWQGKTPFAWRAAGARNTTPQFGGVLLRYAHGRLFVDPKVWNVGRSITE